MHSLFCYVVYLSVFVIFGGQLVLEGHTLDDATVKVSDVIDDETLNKVRRV